MDEVVESEVVRDNFSPSELGRSRRSIGAVLAGVLAIVISTTGIDVVLHATGFFPPWGEPISDKVLLVAFAYRVICSVAGCFITARLAPDRPMRHALALGVVGVLLSTAGAVSTWNAGPAFGNHWYPLALIAVSMPPLDEPARRRAREKRSIDTVGRRPRERSAPAAKRWNGLSRYVPVLATIVMRPI